MQSELITHCFFISNL